MKTNIKHEDCTTASCTLVLIHLYRLKAYWKVEPFDGNHLERFDEEVKIRTLRSQEVCYTAAPLRPHLTNSLGPLFLLDSQSFVSFCNVHPSLFHGKATTHHSSTRLPATSDMLDLSVPTNPLPFDCMACEHQCDTNSVLFFL